MQVSGAAARAAASAFLSSPSLPDRLMPLRVCSERWCARGTSQQPLVHGLPVQSVFAPALHHHHLRTSDFSTTASHSYSSTSTSASPSPTNSNSSSTSIPNSLLRRPPPPATSQRRVDMAPAGNAAGSRVLGSAESRAGGVLAAAAAGGGVPGVATGELQPVEELPEKLQKIVRSFQAVPDPRARYQQLLFYASMLPPLPKDLQIPEYKVVGCVSQVWVVPRLDPEDGCMYFKADSDSQLTKGLAALLVQGLSGSPPKDILRVSPSFITQLGLKQSLTPSRNNGFLNMLRLIQKHTLSLASSNGTAATATDAATATGADTATSAAIAAPSPSPTPSKPAPPPASPPPSGEGGSSSASVGNPPQTKAESMQIKLTELLSPTKLDIVDESHKHAGHAGAREAAALAAAKGKASSGVLETHFNVLVVSSAFEGLNMVKRHRMVYQALDEEFKDGLHALSLITKTPSEFDSK